MADFHDDFHGSALAHASFTVLQALDGAVGGGCRWRREEAKEEEVVKFRTKKREKRERGRGDDIVVNEHVNNTQD